jgi:hypothetical protein
MQNFARTNKGYKYILCIIDVFTRKVWTYKMIKKDNENVQESFRTFLRNSTVQKHTPTILMSDARLLQLAPSGERPRLRPLATTPPHIAPPHQQRRTALED